MTTLGEESLPTLKLLAFENCLGETPSDTESVLIQHWDVRAKALGTPEVFWSGTSSIYSLPTVKYMVHSPNLS